MRQRRVWPRVIPTEIMARPSITGPTWSYAPEAAQQTDRGMGKVRFPEAHPIVQTFMLVPWSGLQMVPGPT